jgi:hypothetical protein
VPGFLIRGYTGNLTVQDLTGKNIFDYTVVNKSQGGTASNAGAYTISNVNIIVQNLNSGCLPVTNSASGTASWNYSTLLSNNTTNRVTAYAVNNIDKKIQSKEIQIIADTIGPVVSITNVPAGFITNVSNMIFTVQSSDALPGIANLYRKFE